ncbi:hypothetical protein AM588_10000594 [Phytophthora nicotianae]|uniref:HAT C-terminal dimerisation domain-containing protein n=1 Tax=Phytophthora nicotianae TaxID=4792 RepID=A0A0W8CHW1_PHYNI|nr:hypothetical protein AM588_10000594 [Phytophthora nicotianae]
MKRLRTLTQAAKLRLKTSLKPKLRQETRWGSTYAMLARYFALREFISADDEDLADLMPSPAANRRLKALLLELADVESVSMKLQSEDLNLLDARDLLDGLLEVKPSFRHYLAPDADIVAAPEFESAVIKVLGGRAKLLSRAEKAALKPFERKTAEAADVTEKTAKVGFADRILKRRKVQEDKSAYSQLNAIPPTSNAAERLFSMARMVLRYERNRLSPLMLEMLLFLKLNSKYWTSQRLTQLSRKTQPTWSLVVPTSYLFSGLVVHHTYLQFLAVPRRYLLSPEMEIGNSNILSNPARDGARGCGQEWGRGNAPVSTAT